MESAELLHYRVRVPPAQAGNAQAIMDHIVRGIQFLGFCPGPTSTACLHYAIDVASEHEAITVALEKIGCLVEVSRPTTESGERAR